MPWIDKVDSLLHAWYGGQETGNGITDILFGRVNPSGRLSVTFPKKIQDNPAFLTFGKADKKILYGEGVFVGYRYYEMIDRPPLFPFGFGLSYTSFEYSALTMEGEFVSHPSHIMSLEVGVRNVSDRDGAEVIQVYVSDIECSVQRPKKELKAFQKVHLAKGEEKLLKLELDKYAVSFWSERLSRWVAEAGTFEVIIARSAGPEDDILRKTFELKKTFSWTGV
jgi:beta-glucosidase